MENLGRAMYIQNGIKIVERNRWELLSSRPRTMSHRAAHSSLPADLLKTLSKIPVLSITQEGLHFTTQVAPTYQESSLGPAYHLRMSQPYLHLPSPLCNLLQNQQPKHHHSDL